MNGISLHWFDALFSQDAGGAISRARSSAPSGSPVAVALVTVVLSVIAGLGFRPGPFRGSAVAFYLAIASLIMPGLFVGLGIALTFRLLGLGTNWFNLGAGRPSSPGPCRSGS